MTPPPAAASRPGFWSFSTAVYSRPGVKEACLALQDAGLDVNVALWIVWTVITGRDPGPALGQGLELSALWRSSVVEKLREARDALKPAPGFIDADAGSALRHRILAAELEGERLQQAALSALSPACPAHERTDFEALSRERLDTCAQACGAQAPTARFVETVFSAVENV
ncbi:MAG: TIGR02444 family protein [Oceanicaulis sp.]